MAKSQRRIPTPDGWRWGWGVRLRKKSGSEWQGRVCGFYSTHLTPEGYAIESELHAGTVQFYPVAALEVVDG